MPSSPKRTRATARTTRSRSRSRGRAATSKVKEVAVKEEVKASASASRIPRRSSSRSPARASKKAEIVKPVKSADVVKSVKTAEVVTSGKSTTAMVTESTVTRRTITSSAGDRQLQASVTPVRSSARIAALIEKEKENAEVLRNKLRSEVLDSIKTPPRSEAEEKNMKKKPSYEFMGPIGVLFLMVTLPLTVYYLNMACRKGSCSISVVPKLPKNIVKAFFDVEVTLIFLAWVAFQALLAVLPIGRVVSGQPLKSGGRLKYRCNGFFALVLSLMALGGAVYLKYPVTIVVDKFFKFMTSAIVFSLCLSITLYISSFFVDKKKLAPSGNTGNHIYDFFIGRELNPRIGPLDLKFFFEMRPGLIGWVLIDWIMVVKAFQESGTFPPGLTLVTLFQTLYVADALWFEDAILTTMDIIHDGFGFMLVFGDIAWVPFLYSLQPRFLLESGFNLPWYILGPIALLNMVGYLIFRLANSQKDKFRKDPKNASVADIETIPTPSGKRLLVGGWWGMCRKPNYLGDLIMATSWSLVTGFSNIIPYFYPIYFLILLVHRERRDNEHCQAKHGKAWEVYCERVKYRIFPRIY